MYIKKLKTSFVVGHNLCKYVQKILQIKIKETTIE